jgi:O-antigen/teichoic acid export membrane protein
VIRQAVSRYGRRSATAAGIYLSVGFGFLGTLFAARELGPEAFGLLSIVIVTTGFFQTLLDLTAEEALVKYGFDYSAAEDWGRLRRLFEAALAIKAAGGLLAGIVLVVLAPYADQIFGGHDLETPMLLAAVLPFAQSPEGVSSSALIIRGRYDVRAWFLATSLGLRMVGLAVGAHFGVTEAVAGMVAAQFLATGLLGAAGLVSFRHFPQLRTELGEHRRRILGFVVQSSLATGIVSLRGALSPLLLGIVTKPVQVGYFRIAQAPMQGLASLSAPARLIMLTEQTRDWSRGAFEAVFEGIRRFTIGSTLLMLVVVPPVFVFMPQLIRFLYGSDYEGAANAARLILVAGAIQLVMSWSKSFPVSIGRPGLRVLAHGIETAVLIPLVVVLGAVWDATGAAAAVLVSTVVFAIVWAVLLVRIKRGSVTPAVPSPAPREAMTL